MGTEVHRVAIAELTPERESWLADQARTDVELQTYQARLDELHESEGAERREARALMHRATLLQKQVESIEQTAKQHEAQLQDLEEAHARATDEERGAEHRMELLDWKLQVAKTERKREHDRRARVIRSTVQPDSAP